MEGVSCDFTPARLDSVTAPNLGGAHRGNSQHPQPGRRGQTSPTHQSCSARAVDGGRGPRHPRGAVRGPERSEGLFTALLDRFGAIGGAELDLPPRSTPVRAANYVPS